MLYDEAPQIDTVIVVPSDLDAMVVPPADPPEFKVPQAGMTFFENDRDRFLGGYSRSLGGTWGAVSGPPAVFHDASGPDENVTRAAELDRAITALIQDMQQNMSANQDFLNLGRDVVALQADWQAWRTDHMSYFQMTLTENDLDRFTNRYNALRTRFTQVVGKTPSAPNITNPEPSNPFGLPTTSAITKTSLAVAALAAIVIFGPTLARHFR